jgi:hypothetical protein
VNDISSDDKNCSLCNRGATFTKLVFPDYFRKAAIVTRLFELKLLKMGDNHQQGFATRALHTELPK